MCYALGARQTVSSLVHCLVEIACHPAPQPAPPPGSHPCPSSSPGGDPSEALLAAQCLGSVGLCDLGGTTLRRGGAPPEGVGGGALSAALACFPRDCMAQRTCTIVHQLDLCLTDPWYAPTPGMHRPLVCTDSWYAPTPGMGVLVEVDNSFLIICDACFSIL